MIFGIVTETLACCVLRNVAICVIAVTLTAGKSVIRGTYRGVADSSSAASKRRCVRRVKSTIAVSVERESLLPSLTAPDCLGG